MDDLKEVNRRYELVAWGVLLVWLGVAWLIPGDANGIGWLGIGVILVGVNLLRRLRGIPLNWLSSALGVIAFIIGAAKQILSLQGQQVELPLLPVLFIVIGVLVLVGTLIKQEATIQP